MSSLTVGEILRRYAGAYNRTHPLPPRKLRAIKALTECRTSAMGTRADQCGECGHLRLIPNSCRDRHCPQCQFLAREKWLSDRKAELLPVGYFHVVFTIPQELRPIFLVNQKLCYTLLFRAAAETIMTLGRDPKHLGAETGLMAVLHTWGQTLSYHPHMHCLVPAGGLSEDGERWVHCRRPDFFVHVQQLSELFRGKLLDFLRAAYYRGELTFSGSIAHYAFTPVFDSITLKLSKRDWVVHCQPPFGGPAHVVGYLGRYTHRVAISNDRILEDRAGRIWFNYKDYDDGDQVKVMGLTHGEFVHRFLLHILPRNFCKIRYYGLLATRNRRTKYAQARNLLGVGPVRKPELDLRTLLIRCTGNDPKICPQCKAAAMAPAAAPFAPRQPTQAVA